MTSFLDGPLLKKSGFIVSLSILCFFVHCVLEKNSKQHKYFKRSPLSKFSSEVFDQTCLGKKSYRKLVKKACMDCINHVVHSRYPFPTSWCERLYWISGDEANCQVWHQVGTLIDTWVFASWSRDPGLTKNFRPFTRFHVTQVRETVKIKWNPVIWGIFKITTSRDLNLNNQKLRFTMREQQFYGEKINIYTFIPQSFLFKTQVIFQKVKKMSPKLKKFSKKFNEIRAKKGG